MQHRRTGIVTTLLLLSFINLGGCTTTYLELKSWEGRKISDLYFEWGKADEVEGAQDSERVHTWITKRKDGDKEKVCRKSFYTRNFGHGEVIVDTKYSGCLFLTIK